MGCKNNRRNERNKAHCTMCGNVMKEENKITENMKKYLELISKDEKAKKELSEFEKEALKENEETAFQKMKEKAISDAAEKGITLTDADFENKTGELSDDELDQAAGGGQCVCILSGGGESETNAEKNCNCIAFGLGKYTKYVKRKSSCTALSNTAYPEESNRCACVGYGNGNAKF